MKARASKSCWWGARKLRVGRACRAQASLSGGATIAIKHTYSVDENKVAKLGCQKSWAGVPNWVKAQEWACANRKEHDNEQQPQTSRGFCRSRTRRGRNGRPDAWSETRAADRHGRTSGSRWTHDGWDSWPSPPPPSPPWLESSAPAAPASATSASAAEALALMAASSGWRCRASRMNC